MYRIFRKIKNIIRWIPILWEDEDYDGYFTTLILINKLKFQKEYFEKYGISANKEEDIKEIQQTIDLLNKTIDVWNYEEPVLDELDEKWGKRSSEFIKIPESKDPIMFQFNINREKIKTDEDLAQYSKEMLEAVEKAQKQYEEEKKEAYIFLATNIDKWWD